MICFQNLFENVPQLCICITCASKDTQYANSIYFVFLIIKIIKLNAGHILIYVCLDKGTCGACFNIIS